MDCNFQFTSQIQKKALAEWVAHFKAKNIRHEIKLHRHGKDPEHKKSTKYSLWVPHEVMNAKQLREEGWNIT